jgi:hypothetical protein
VGFTIEIYHDARSHERQTIQQILAEFNCGWDPSSKTRISDVAQEEMYHFRANFAQYVQDERKILVCMFSTADFNEKSNRRSPLTALLIFL